ncbi:MAG TPA: ABC transporter ATP-binding protein [Methylomirabilota bacterium]|nr:ABC transporter ATP-binding protein [Methylomirabilota bacterium]
MLDVQNLIKLFSPRDGSPVKAIDDVSFTVEPGQFFTLLGPSGCGKTTTLRCVAGLERPQSGRISLRGTAVFDSTRRIFVVPNHRNVGMVFQSYAIWPHLNVFDNVAFPLRASGTRDAGSITRKVASTLELVGLGGFATRPATQLSGGQQQRVALARALVKEPDVLLLDEPLSNLDAKLRERMRSELKRLQRELGITTLYVTHDQMEAMVLSDRLAVMNGGHVLQLGTPDNIYERPQSQFVADFMGSTNLIAGILRKQVRGAAIEIVETDLGPLQCSFSTAFDSGSKVVISVRPEYIKIAPGVASEGNNVLKGRIRERSVWLGMAQYSVDVRGVELQVRAGVDGAGMCGNENVCLKLTPDKCVAMASDKGGQSHETAATI